jgi:hypothetical protein
MTLIPKKRRVYVKEDGTLFGLDKISGQTSAAVYAASGTLLGDGHLTVSGTQFRTNSVVVATYDKSSAGTAPVAVQTTDGTVTFYGDASQNFYFVVVNKSPVAH